MTPKQIERAKNKIADIKRTLAAEKRKFGCYDDSRGLRYLPTKYFIQLGDYSGGLAYLKWLDKNFPGDSGFPEFLFDRIIILFKSGKTKEVAIIVSGQSLYSYNVQGAPFIFTIDKSTGDIIHGSFSGSVSFLSQNTEITNGVFDLAYKFR